MQLHDIQSDNKKKKRIGRGGKRGTYSGRGMKGQKSRSGHKLQPVIRELIKSYPKLRGYRNKAFKVIAEVNLDVIDKNFKDGDVINPTILTEKGIIRKISGKIPSVKILGNGEITKKVTLEKVLFSQSVKSKIEKAGGSVKVLEIEKEKPTKKVEKKEVKKEEKKETKESTEKETKKVTKKPSVTKSKVTKKTK